LGERQDTEEGLENARGEAVFRNWIWKKVYGEGTKKEACGGGGGLAGFSTKGIETQLEEKI